jgi:hypothetical protein
LLSGFRFSSTLSGAGARKAKKTKNRAVSQTRYAILDIARRQKRKQKQGAGFGRAKAPLELLLIRLNDPRFSENLERRIPRRDIQHPPAPFPLMAKPLEGEGVVTRCQRS